jgi:hypothetical protein
MKKAMDTKLTLKLDKDVIEKAKEYASDQKRSLSGIVEAYLKSIVNKDVNKVGENFEISDYIKGLRSGVKIPDDINVKKEYKDYLEEKYK